MPPSSFAIGSGSIGGIVQYKGSAVPDQRIMLVRFGPNQQDVQRTPGQTNSQGEFVFENLETGPNYTYFVGVRYNEQLHRSTPVTLPTEQRAELVLDIEEASSPEPENSSRQPTVYIANHLIVVVRRDTALEVREIVRLVNAGETPYTEGTVSLNSAQAAFHLLLPQGYSNLSQVQGLASENIKTNSSGLSYMAPLAPGEHRVIFSYSLPWRDDLATILLERTLPTSILDLLVEDQRLMSTSDLAFGGQVTIDPHTFAHFRGVSLNPQTRHWLQLTLPGAALSSVLTMSTYGFIVTLALLGIAVPLHTRRQLHTTDVQRAQGPPTPERIPEAREVAKHMLQELALLDESLEGGSITAELYQQRRKDCKTHLRNLVAAYHV